MKKILVFSVLAIFVAGANIASAQSYYYSTPTYGASSFYPSYNTSVACVNITSDLSYGSNGGQVRQLQTFLVSQNFPGSGAWMITGNFRSATLAAVRNFQAQQGLPATGIVDAATRAAIYRVSCGGYGGFNYGNAYVSPTTYPPVSSTNCYYTFPYTCDYQYQTNYQYQSGYPWSGYNYNRVSLTSVSPTTGLPGTNVTVHGSGLDYINNTVYLGSTPIGNVPSYNGSSLTFAIPQSAPGTVGLYVTNSRGTSNTLNFGVLGSYGYGSGYGCGQYGYGSNVYGYYGTPAYGYCPPVTSNPTITYLSPNSGPIGQSVTVYGSGFSSSGNTVRFGGAVVSNVSSYNGTLLTFTVPSYFSGGYSSIIPAGVYSVSVSNNVGYTSNAVSFTVTSGSAGAPTVSSISGPTALPTGTQGVWTVRIQNPSATYMTTSVNWGDSATGLANTAMPQTVYQQGENTLSFTHTYYAAGTYTIVFTVTNASGLSSTASATVVVSGSGSYGGVTLNSISPMSARVGSQIILSGSGFTLLENTVRFGIGGMQHVPSYNGSTIYYTVPAYVSPCDVITPGNVCTMLAQQVLPGPISVYVTNANGTTNTIQLQIIN